MKLTITKPFDGHAHLRQGQVLEAVLPFAIKQFGRVVAMPNLNPPITTSAKAAEYYKEILEISKNIDKDFEPIMSIYLTDETNPDDLEDGFKKGIIKLAKLYPSGSTTNSGLGVTDIKKIHPVLERMQRIGMILSVHGEVTEPDVDIFDREKVFIDKVLIPLRKKFPELKIVFEHISCCASVEYISEEGNSGNIAATITAHHLLINRNDMLSDGLKPHYYCMPLVKTEKDRQELVKAATSGKEMFFAGTDSAPHLRSAKEADVCAPGCFTHANAVFLYAQVFDDENKLDKLEAFLSINGPSFYGLDIKQLKISIEKNEFPLSEIKPILTRNNEIIPFKSRKPVFWSFSNLYKQ